MKSRIWLATGLLVLCTAARAFADEKQKKEMSAQEMQEKMMEAYMKAGTPGDAHKALEPFVGKWEARTTFWPVPGAEPQTSTGESEHRWILDGRFVEQRFTGNIGGMPFTGIGYTGYDNIRKQYIGMWLDSMGTGMMLSTGKAADGGKAWEFEATHPDPMTGKDMKMKETVKLIDSDKHVFEMWSPTPDGKGMYKSMEIVYTRKKS